MTWALPAPACPSPVMHLTHRVIVQKRGMMPKAARERVVANRRPREPYPFRQPGPPAGVLSRRTGRRRFYCWCGRWCQTVLDFGNEIAKLEDGNSAAQARSAPALGFDSLVRVHAGNENPALMPGLVAGIHDLLADKKDGDGRNKSGHDEADVDRMSEATSGILTAALRSRARDFAVLIRATGLRSCLLTHLRHRIN